MNEAAVDELIEAARALGRREIGSGVDPLGPIAMRLNAARRAMLAAAPTPLLAEMQKPDQDHFAANGDEAKSLQPLLDAEALVRNLLWDDHPECCGNPVVGAEYGGQQELVCCGCPEPASLNDAQIVATLRAKFPAALGNRTPARQEERSSGNESASAPLPVQGQDGAMVKQPYCIEGLVAAVAVGDNPEVAAIFDTPAQAHGFVNYLKRFIEPSPAALRASSAPTTKG